MSYHSGTLVLLHKIDKLTSGDKTSCQDYLILTHSYVVQCSGPSAVYKAYVIEFKPKSTINLHLNE